MCFNPIFLSANFNDCFMVADFTPWNNFAGAGNWTEDDTSNGETLVAFSFSFAESQMDAKMKM